MGEQLAQPYMGHQWQCQEYNTEFQIGYQLEGRGGRDDDDDIMLNLEA